MLFEVQPIIDIMEDLYRMPQSPARFQAYLKLLQGDTKDDMILPIGAYNPMAKAHVVQKLLELKQLDAERLMKEVLQELNSNAESSTNETIKVVLNLADDLKGGWTNRYTTDYDSKFKINALVSRNFCAPYFWSGESYTPTLIQERTISYARRTLYWKAHGKPHTLEDHLKQEIFALQYHTKIDGALDEASLQEVESFYQEHKKAEGYSIIFNFFYGDDASRALGYATFGIQKMNGFQYAKLKARMNGRNLVTK